MAVKMQNCSFYCWQTEDLAQNIILSWIERPEEVIEEYLLEIFRAWTNCVVILRLYYTQALWEIANKQKVERNQSWDITPFLVSAVVKKGWWVGCYLKESSSVYFPWMNRPIKTGKSHFANPESYMTSAVMQAVQTRFQQKLKSDFAFR